MDPNRDPHAGEDATAAREHAANAKENRDAQAAQAERVRATAPGESGSTGAARVPDNAAALRRVAEGHDALEEQNRRVAATAPDDVPMTGPDANRPRQPGS